MKTTLESSSGMENGETVTPSSPPATVVFGDFGDRAGEAPLPGVLVGLAPSGVKVKMATTTVGEVWLPDAGMVFSVLVTKRGGLVVTTAAPDTGSSEDGAATAGEPYSGRESWGTVTVGLPRVTVLMTELTVERVFAAIVTVLGGSVTNAVETPSQVAFHLLQERQKLAGGEARAKRYLTATQRTANAESFYLGWIGLDDPT